MTFATIFAKLLLLCRGFPRLISELRMFFLILGLYGNVIYACTALYINFNPKEVLRFHYAGSEVPDARFII